MMVDQIWVVLPIKLLKNGKRRLAKILSQEQRAKLVSLILIDMLKTLSTSSVVRGVTLVSSDNAVSRLADEFETDFILMESDNGYSADVESAIKMLPDIVAGKIAIIPADIPHLTHDDLDRLAQSNDSAITMCPAEKDGGTNALVFTPPLSIPLLFGSNSFRKHQQAAEIRGIGVNTIRLSGMQRDIDKPDDLEWLCNRPAGLQAWAYTKKILGK